MTKKVKKAKRLYEQFQPEHYELELSPSAESMRFEGVVTIHGRKVGRPSQRITLHQKDLRITSAKVSQHDKKGEVEKLQVERTNHHRRYDELRLHAKKLLYPGKYTLVLAFEGKITEHMQGLYPCKFTYEGKEQVLLATQFESHHAREVFPCIDEPEAKATFVLTLYTQNDQTVLSNTPVATQTTKADLTRTTFEKTPKMSTYLLAFAVGNMHCVETKSKSGVIVRSWSSVAQPKSHLDYATKEAASILDYFADYFGIPYPLEKLDQLALPDFDSGAMENWGLITYREIALLTDPVNRSISNEQFVTLVIAHELSHQWFGNLVTMKWWDDLWLNESFAGLMEHIAPAALHPDWHQWEHYALSDIALITSRDVYRDIQPVGVEVTDPELIETLFDPAIVYAKGARLLKMLHDYIGEEAFRSGLKAYFKKHAYTNATRADLWEALSSSSGKDIGSFMTPWLTQSGMPVLHIEQNMQAISLTQERFLLDAEPDDTLWPIPLLASQQLKPDLLPTAAADVKASSDEFIIFNPQASGQFISNYRSLKHQAFITQAFSKQSMSAEARINTLNDFFMLARHGDASLTNSLDIVSTSSNETRDGVWGLMTRVIGSSGQLTEGNEVAEAQLKQLRIRLAQDWYMKLGWDHKPKDDPNTLQLRQTIIGLMIAGEDPSAIEEALKRYRGAASLAVVDAELRSIILTAVVRYGTQNDRDTLLKAYKDQSSEIQHDISAALTATKDKNQAKKLIDAALGKNGFVRTQDVMRWLALMMRNYYTRDVIWQFMVDNWPDIEKTLNNSKSFSYLPTYAAAVISTEDWAKSYNDLFEPQLSKKTLERNIRIGQADIAGRIAWRKRDEPVITQWLKKHSSL